MPDAVGRRKAWLLFLVVWLACSQPGGPAPVAWDRTRCARCGMLVSEPASAAQRRSDAGEVLHYDDPGCLLVSSPEVGPATTGVYFHHRSEERWISGTEVGFVPAESTPMGYGLAAVLRGEAADAIGIPEARRRSLARDAERSGGSR